MSHLLIQRIFLMSMLAAGSVQDLFAAENNPPNIIYIMLDEWGYYEQSAMGHPILETPNIDRMAKQGMRFTQMLAGGNVCAPTRCVLMTGKHLGHTSIRGNKGGNALRADEQTLASMLKKEGYATGGFGKWGLGDRGTTGVPENHGFDVFFGYYHQVHAHTYYPNYLLRNSEKIPLEGNRGDYLQGETHAHELIYAESMKFIKEKAKKEQPFFAYLAWTPPHGFWGLPDALPEWKKYKDKKWDAKNQRGKYDAQMYAAMVEWCDRQIGEIFSLLNEMSIDNHTIVIVCGDNGGKKYFSNKKHPDGVFAPNRNPDTGKQFRGGKGNFYEGGLRIPFIVRWPEKIKADTVSDHLGYFPDIMPTVAELIGIDPPNHTDGISFLPTLLGRKTQTQHEFLYWEDLKSRAVRMGNWKAVKGGTTKPWELYDLAVDIEEKSNLAKKKPEILARMTKYAQQAHKPMHTGRIIDKSSGFQGHQAK